MCCDCQNKEANKPFYFTVVSPNKRLEIPCLRFAGSQAEAERIGLAQHGNGWSIKTPENFKILVNFNAPDISNSKYSPFSDSMEHHQSFA